MVELREFTIADGRLLASWIDGPTELLMWAGRTLTWPLDDDQFAAYARESAGDQSWSWMARDSGTGKVIGHVSLRVDVPGANGRIMRVLVAPQARGRGYGRAILERVLAVAFGELGLERLELGVYTHNTGAMRLYRQLGFGCDTVVPNVEQVDGHLWSTMEMSIWKNRRPGAPHLG